VTQRGSGFVLTDPELNKLKFKLTNYPFAIQIARYPTTPLPHRRTITHFVPLASCQISYWLRWQLALGFVDPKAAPPQTIPEQIEIRRQNYWLFGPSLEPSWNQIIPNDVLASPDAAAYQLLAPHW